MQMGELNPKQKKGVDYILSSGQHLLNLIDEVLDISRIESGKLSLMPEPIHLSRFIHEIMESVLPLANSCQLKIALQNTLDSDLFILCDRKLLRQVLLNLINNAVKYNHPGGSIFILSQALPKDNDGESFFRISVTDTGPGIQPGDISKLFIPFERIGAAKTHIEGAGLGLAIVKKLIEAMKGTVGVTSVVGEGSTFRIDLPVNGNLRSPNENEPVENRHGQVNQTEGALPAGTGVIPADGTILYIEDNVQNAELVKEIMETYRPQIRLIISAFGSPAVGLAIQHRPGLILLDLDLPDMNGSNVLANLGAEEKTKSIPVVMVTADATQKQVHDQMAAGARGYLTKPLDVNMFLQVVDKWIGK
jgi:CheY-like chemotaxis protein/two-component sensor histidine kinase